MRRFARWHIWLGWLTGIPLLMWTITGLVMVAKPIEEVRGNHLKIAQPELPLPLPPGRSASISIPAGATDNPVKSISVRIERGRWVTSVAYADGSSARFAASGELLPSIDETIVRQIVADGIVGGDRVASVTPFEAESVPFDFRRPVDVWQVALEDGTHVYVGQDTGRIEAVRTRWWRVFDTMWGLHIMDLQTREDTSHPALIGFAALAALSALLGCVLLFRRRSARSVAKPL